MMFEEDRLLSHSTDPFNKYKHKIGSRSTSSMMRKNTHTTVSNGSRNARLALMLLLLLIQLSFTIAFTTPSCRRADVTHQRGCRATVIVPTTKAKSSFSSTELQWGFFRRDNNSEKLEETNTSNDDTSGSGKEGQAIETSSTANVTVTGSEDTTVVAVVDPPKPLTPEEEAARLRNEAAKSRLEAERMDAELTLRKIDKLEKALKRQQMEVATNATSASTSTTKKSPEDIQREIDVLVRKVRGEPATTTTATNLASMPVSTPSTITARSASEESLWPKYVKDFKESDYQILFDSINGLPKFILGPMAIQVEVNILEIDPSTNKTKTINTKQLAERIDQLRRQDFSYSKKGLPNFTQSQVSVLQKEIEEFFVSDKNIASNKGETTDGGSWWDNIAATESNSNMFYAIDEVPTLLQLMKNDARYQPLFDAKDSKSIAILILEYKHYMTATDADLEKEAEKLVQFVTEDEWIKPFINNANLTGTNAVIESLYPKCTTKKDIVFDTTTTTTTNIPSPIPTEAQVKKLIADILPKASFQVTSKPEPVLGGYIVRGTTKLSGDAFIEQLDSVMDKSNLKNQMSVMYVNDFTILGEEVNFDPSDTASSSTFPDDGPPILYVASANICRESLPIRLSIVSAFGLATSWYFSVYPFLLNPGIATRVDEQLAIADANMVADLSWLSDLSLPLFATFMSIQLSHELGHLIVAGANGIKTSPPTFVPSLFTGITSTVTTFRNPPKNTATMFDYATAGPLAGIITSILAIAVGCQITSVTSDVSLFPALPLEILRQSTLGGGVIEFVLGNGALSLPKAAIGTAAVAGMTVPLHPIAIAGFISLIINALAVLPIGTTDGGRMAIALFGRVFKISVATLALIAILFLGAVGDSDLFLFYFMFCVIFQRGNEIPARNEIDKLDLPRCFVAGGLYVVAALALIPFQ